MSPLHDPIDRLYERLLVLRCQTGDESAFAELVGRYQPRLRRFLGRMLAGDEHAAEDALQDVWLDVFRGVGKLRDLGAFAGWLWRVARDRAHRVLRRRGVSIGEIEDAVDLIDPVAGDDAEIGAEEKEQLHGSLDRLPPAQREVLLLRFVEEL